VREMPILTAATVREIITNPGRALPTAVPALSLLMRIILIDGGCPNEVCVLGNW
jgi:hypothetical protein